MRPVLLILALGLLASGTTLGPAAAATASASFSVSATVQAFCQASANAMAFETLAAKAASTTSPVSVTCSHSVPYYVGLSEAMGGGANVAIQEIAGPGTALSAYALSPSVGGSVNRGETMRADTVKGTGNSSAQALAGHHLISVGRYIGAGTYFDTMIVTVTF